MTITLRPATGGDAAFLRGLYASTREAELAILPWTATEKQAFLTDQFTLQDRHYCAAFEGASFEVIVIDGVDAGRLIVHPGDQTISVLDIALLPGFRNLGAGTFLLTRLMMRATAARKPLRLCVESFSPALRLYLRLGFLETGDSGVHRELRWHPPADAQPNTTS